MKKNSFWLLLPLVCLVSACQGNKVSPSSSDDSSASLPPSTSTCEHDYELVLKESGDRYTYIAGDEFDATGISLELVCKNCSEKIAVEEFEVEDGEELILNQEKVTLKYQEYELEYPIAVKEKYHIACCGDSLTAGHYWANQSYPSYLSNKVSSRYEVGNFGVNGISITGYGGSWNDPDQRYIKQDVYRNSVNFAPDIFAIMLGTNDATGWLMQKQVLSMNTWYFWIPISNNSHMPNLS